MKLEPFVKMVRAALKRWFRHRNLIIIADRNVSHYTLSSRTQQVIFTAVVVVVCFVSYALGSFVAGRSVLSAKEEALHATLMENRKLVQEFSMLKRDLTEIKVDESKLSPYGQFLLKQYAETNPAKDESPPSGIYVSGDGALARINFLEDRISEMQENNLKLLKEIQETTSDKIREFNDIFADIGLDEKDVKKALAQEEKAKSRKGGKDKLPQDALPVGGPFLPADPIRFDLDSSLVLKDISRLMSMNQLLEMLPLGEPILQASVMSPFGKRSDPFTRRAAIHTGMDLAGPKGSTIYSTGNGRVKFAGRMPGYGNVIDIDHGRGLVTRYGHLSKILVKAGDQIAKGDKIGIQGSTGRSTGPHLHYEVRKEGIPINPRTYLEAGRKMLSRIALARR